LNCANKLILNDKKSYYTFTVKGYMENNHAFAPNARAVQECIEEKVIGAVHEEYFDKIQDFPLDALPDPIFVNDLGALASAFVPCFDSYKGGT